MGDERILGCHQDLTSGVTASLPVQSSDTLVDQAAARPVTPGSNNQSPSTPESATASDSPLEFCSTPSPTGVDKQVSALRTHY